MKFGVSVPLEPRADTRHPWDHVFEYCARVEALGYDFVVLGHHRFTPGFPLHPWVTLGAIAARTETLRLGTSIALLPLDHPLDTAEEIATVDQMSNGRVFLGAGLGYRPYEYESLGLDFHTRGRRMSECLEIVQRAWTEDTFSFHGEFFDFDDVGVYPKPVQQPRPTIWIGANSDAAVRRGARLTDGWMVGFGDRLPTAVERIATFREESRAHGRRGEICLMRLVGIGATREQVEETWLPDVLATLRGYARAGAPQDRNDDVRKVARSERPSLEGLGNDLFVAGTPDDVIAGLRRAVDMTGCEYVMPSMSGGDDPLAPVEMFGREVIPAFR